jgi:hypothetical protein
MTKTGSNLKINKHKEVSSLKLLNSKILTEFRRKLIEKIQKLQTI